MRSVSLVSLGLIVGLIFSALIATAWTGPTASPQNGNVSAPVNVGSTNQTKNANLGMNGLAVFGNTLLQAAGYINWGTISGTTGYGIRDNAGILEFKNSGGAWASLQSTVATLCGGGACGGGWTPLRASPSKVSRVATISATQKRRAICVSARRGALQVSLLNPATPPALHSSPPHSCKIREARNRQFS